MAKKSKPRARASGSSKPSAGEQQAQQAPESETLEPVGDVADDQADSDRTPDFGEERASLEPRRDVAEISAYIPNLDDDALDGGVSSIPPRKAREISGDVDAELRAVEAEVDRIFQQSKKTRMDEGALRSVVDRIREVLPVELPGEHGDLVDAAKDVLSTDYYLRQWGRIGLRNRSEEVDEFGLDPVYEQRFRPLFDFLYKSYFRTEVSGIEHLPADGRCIIVANHSGVLPYDGIMVRTAVRREHPSQREVRWLAEDFIFHLPFVGAFMNRIGAVRACQENAERLLRQERAVLVFPEGIKGIGKLYNQKYKLQRFGRGGFIKLALRTGAPIIPLSIVGAEETSPMLYRLEYLTEAALGLPFIPVTPTFPALGALGLVPAPAKWKLVFGAPIDLEGHGAEAADDALLVVRLAERVRTAIQTTLDQNVAQRKSVWFG
jgi:1-acyl-sn-glycerol-3-phosphate acyltransferase